MASKLSSRIVPALLVFALLAALLGGWVHLYVNSHAANSDRQNEILGLLKDMKQRDSDWTANVLRSHTDINLNYDALAEPLRPFADTLARLDEQVTALPDAAFGQAVKDIRGALDAKTSLIDSFKAQNSLFKNSLRYVPTAHKDIQARMKSERDAGTAAESSARRETHKALDELEKSLATAGQAGADDSSAQRRVEQALARMRSRVKAGGASDGSLNGVMNLDGNVSVLVDEALRYSSLPDRESAEAIRAGIDRMRTASAGYSPAVREPVFNLLSHLDTLLRLRSKQADLLRDISGVPVASKIDALSGLLTQRFTAELARQFQYQRYLLAYSAFALLLVIGGTGFILYRNATERQRLSRLVDQQTTALKENEAQLVHAQKMGAIGEMAAGLAHEVNTPLAALKSSLESSRELLSEVREHYKASGRYVELSRMPQPLDAAEAGDYKARLDAQWQAVSELRANIDEFDSLGTLDQLMDDGVRSVAHIYGVVVNMLNFSRLDRTKVAAAKLEEGIDSTLAIAHHLLKSVAVRKEYGDTKPLHCDMAQVNQVVLNLVKNAAQALPEAGGVIRIRTSMRSDNEVRLDVIDNGSGIPQDILGKIWEPFFTTKPAGLGTGLGLSTCKKIITAHGGKVFVESQVGKGTAFSIILPVTPPDSLYEAHGQRAGHQLVTA